MSDQLLRAGGTRHAHFSLIDAPAQKQAEFARYPLAARLHRAMIELKARDPRAKFPEVAYVAEAGQASSWFVPPLVVPALLAALIVAYGVYQAYL